MKKMILPLLLVTSLVFGSCGDQTECCAPPPEPDPFTSYFTGDEADAQVTPDFGITMMGGRSEHDNAMRWFLQKANGGDVLVIRASGSDGYNDYLFSELGETVNSVETLVINNADAADHPYVIEQINNAEAIWMAGGDQSVYLSLWGNSGMRAALNAHINTKKGVIGGTSAGMAVLGQWVYSAENGTITSSEALANPFDNRLTITEDFLNISVLDKVITDTHYAARDRQGRHSAFMARLAKTHGGPVFGIACDEYTAVNIGTDGIARVYGSWPDHNDAVYFIQSRCDTDPTPEVCEAGSRLTWNLDKKALYVYKIQGTNGGLRYFNLNNWREGEGGEWFNWYVEDGSWFEINGQAPDCG